MERTKKEGVVPHQVLQGSVSQGILQGRTQEAVLIFSKKMWSLKRCHRTVSRGRFKAGVEIPNHQCRNGACLFTLGPRLIATPPSRLSLVWFDKGAGTRKEGEHCYLKLLSKAAYVTSFHLTKHVKW